MIQVYSKIRQLILLANDSLNDADESPITQQIPYDTTIHTADNSDNSDSNGNDLSDDGEDSSESTGNASTATSKYNGSDLKNNYISVDSDGIDSKGFDRSQESDEDREHWLQELNKSVFDLDQTIHEQANMEDNEGSQAMFFIQSK